MTPLENFKELAKKFKFDGGDLMLTEHIQSTNDAYGRGLQVFRDFFKGEKL